MIASPGEWFRFRVAGQKETALAMVIALTADSVTLKFDDATLHEPGRRARTFTNAEFAAAIFAPFKPIARPAANPRT